MKKVLFSLLGVLFCISINSNVVYSASDYDTIFNDGKVSEFVIPQSAETDNLELLPYEGDADYDDPVIPDIPSDAEYIESEIDLGLSGVSSRGIIGTDRRRIVNDTTVDPYKRIVFMLMKFPNGKSYIGSGNLISSDTVLTAAHCIYDKSAGGWAQVVSVYPGNNGSYAPFGKANAKSLMVTRGWIDKQAYQYDLGAIKLDKAIGNSVGWFGLTTNMTGSITLSGYHGDLNQKMGTETGNISRLTEDNVFYKLSSTGGSSGSGVYNNNKEILAVHAYSAGSENFGTRINTNNFYLVRSWVTGLSLTSNNTWGVNYDSHVQSKGWVGNVSNGSVSGSVGEKKRMEAIRISIAQLGSGGIQYRSHVQTHGWMNWVSNRALSGTTGQAKRMEAIEIKLTGDVSKVYDIEYRAHVSGKGWLAWKRNGATAGTVGEARQVEAIQIRLIKK